MLTIHKDSHLDHSLEKPQVAHILERYADRNAFFIDTFELPFELGTVACGLYGPLMGDAPVTDARYGVRGAREYVSRLVQRPSRVTNKVTVIAGPHDGQNCVLFTAFGGPLAPKEPGETGAAITKFMLNEVMKAEPSMDPNELLVRLIALGEEHEKSMLFWADHALAL